MLKRRLKSSSILTSSSILVPLFGLLSSGLASSGVYADCPNMAVSPTTNCNAGVTGQNTNVILAADDYTTIVAAGESYTGDATSGTSQAALDLNIITDVSSITLVTEGDYSGNYQGISGV